MSTTIIAYEARRSGLLVRIADYFELTKPKISILVLVTVAVAAFAASWGTVSIALLGPTLAGTALVAASASALNQWLERKSDALMRRTQDRPLPAGRLTAAEVLLFSGAAICAGVGILAWQVNWLAAALGFVTWLVYVAVYTPLKSVTPANTAVGAIAGALPVLIGWTSVGGPLDLGAACLFLLVYLWQFPHFMAIAWLYRHDYQRAGLRMLSVVDPTGRRAAFQSLISALALLPVSLLPVIAQGAGKAYIAVALLLGVGQLLTAMAFAHRLNEQSARRLLRASLIYLPAMLLLWTLIPLI